MVGINFTHHKAYTQPHTHLSTTPFDMIVGEQYLRYRGDAGADAKE
jgi:hypothetical protein